MNALRPWLAFGTGGFAVGVCLSLCLTCTLLASRAITRPVALAATPSAVATMQVLPMHTRTPVPPVSSPGAVPTSIADAWFAEAGRLMAAGKPQQALDLLRSKIDLMTEKQDRADAYYYMGEAELQLKHYQLAAAQFAKLQELDPSAEHLFMAAIAYDMGGDLEHALANYEALLMWQGYVNNDYYDAANARAKELRRIIGTPTPRPL